jgi:5-methylcytosine-specific restriction enzyme A
MALADLTRDAVLQALAEFIQRGRDAFLQRYGYGPARRYFVMHEGRECDSKAVAGVAHRFLPPDYRALTAAEFSGGEATVAATLRGLEFEVTKRGRDQVVSRNPDWTRDELILALDLYMRNPQSPAGKTSKEVAELSAVLRLLGQRLGRTTDGNYRNANGVYMKMMNFRRFDPAFTASGRAGLTRGNRDEQIVWNEFAKEPAHLKAVAFTIVAALRDEREWSYELPAWDDDFTEAPEGRVLTRVHVTKERNRKLVDKKKRVELHVQDDCAAKLANSTSPPTMANAVAASLKSIIRSLFTLWKPALLRN